MISSMCPHSSSRVLDLCLHIPKPSTIFMISGQPVRHVERFSVAGVALITKLLTLKAPIGPSVVRSLDREPSVVALPSSSPFNNTAKHGIFGILPPATLLHIRAPST
jgi:hypothetical protein